MKLFPLRQKDRAVFEDHLKNTQKALSSYALENFFLWQAHFDVLWNIINDKLCVFFKNKAGCFMNTAPLGGLDAGTIEACFNIMEDFNHNRDVSRIENIQEEDLEFFKSSGFKTYEKAKEYIVSSDEMANLKGEKFKHKRNLVNFFEKNHDFKIRPYVKSDKREVLKLYKKWMAGRKVKNADSIYEAMMEDSYKVLSRQLELFDELNLRATVVECTQKIRGFTCGFQVSEKLFCINFEIADLDFKGLPQYIFSRFAQELRADFPQINMMDDSGIENIRATKLSYKPVRTVASYTALMTIDTFR